MSTIGSQEVHAPPQAPESGVPPEQPEPDGTVPPTKHTNASTPDSGTSQENAAASPSETATNANSVETSTAEVDSPPELAPVTGERKFQEAGIILHTEASKQYHKGLQDKNHETPQEAAVNAYYLFTRHKQNPNEPLESSIPLTSGSKYRVHMDSGHYVAAEKGGFLISTIVTKETRDDGVYFQCALEDNTDLVFIHVDELIRAQLMSEGDLITSSFEDGTKQKKLAEEYISAQKAGSKELQSDGVVEQAAKESAIPTAEAMRRLIVGANENTDIDAKTAEDLLLKLEGTSIVDQQTAGEILTTINVTGSQITAIDSEIATETVKLQEYKTQIKSMPDGEAKQQLQFQHDALIGTLAGLQEKKASLEQLQATINELPGGAEFAITELLTPLYEGTMDPAQAQEFLSSLQNGDTMRILESLVEDLEKNGGDKKYIEMGKNAIKYGSLGMIAILALMIIQGLQGGK